MPFVSEKQRRYCYFLAGQARKQGKEPSWDCEAYGKGEDRSPRRSSPSPRRSPGKKIFTGPRGGRYTISDGRKVYVK